ncbi:MAG: protein kinase domain-containing protein [Solirubrobacteraceae bacterium]
MSQNTPTIPLPAVPERYKVRSPLASGGMGSVWLGTDTTLDRDVAIKLLGEAFTGDHQAVRRFMREARAAARLSSHPNVVTIFDVGEFGGRPYIVMEYLSGGTVAARIKQGDVPREQALGWLEQAAAALDYAHGRGVVHRDVKPSNMLIGDDGEVRLADFGIASLGAEPTITNTGQLMGTAAYFSPEQARGGPATEASDRYALAVTAFQLLTGSKPFRGEHFAAQARAHIEQQPPRASEIEPSLPRAVDGVLRRGMAKQDVERWPTATGFTAALRDAVQREPEPGWSPIAAFHPPKIAFTGAAEGRAKFPRAASRAARAPAFAALVLAALTIGLLIATNNTGAPPTARAFESAVISGSHHGSRNTHRSAAPAHPKPVATQPKTASTPPATPAAPGTTTPAPATATTLAPGTSATALEAQGHALMQGGAYAQALPILRQAVTSAPTNSLIYAYALYDLGRTLRLAGDPLAAIPILERRLQIPNQPGVVAAELGLARQQAGQAQVSNASPTAAPAPTVGAAPGLGDGHGQGHAFGHDHGQGQGQGQGQGGGGD